MIRPGISAVMITVDRSPGRNYLRSTLQSLKASDLHTSRCLQSFTLCDSGPGGVWARLNLDDTIGGDSQVPLCAVLSGPTKSRHPANHNASLALQTGAYERPTWVLFLEDDIQVCANLFDSVAAWLDDYAIPGRTVYAFGNARPAVAGVGRQWFDCPYDEFYGTQAIAMRWPDAVWIGQYLWATPDPPGEYDLSIVKWLKQHRPDQGHIRVAVPSFVQHIGAESVIRPGSAPFTFPSFPGTGWSYLTARRDRDPQLDNLLRIQDNLARAIGQSSDEVGS